MLVHALNAVARGLWVVPSVPGSRRPAHRLAAASLDVAQVMSWWTYSPEANPLIACKPSGILVLDTDTPKPGHIFPPDWQRPGIGDGMDVLSALCEEHSITIPTDTLTILTPRGGFHYVFEQPPGVQIRNSQGRVGPLIDIVSGSGDFGGCTPAPGARREEGEYSVLVDGPPRPMPPGLVKLCSPPGRQRPDATARDTTWTATGGKQAGLLRWLGTVGPGEQSQALYRVARDLRSEGMPFELALTQLWDVVQGWQLSGDPWQHRQVEMTVRSAYR